MAKQIFFDSFTGSDLDTSKWSPVWGKFDPEKGTQMRFSDKNISLVRNNFLSLTGTVATGADAEKAPFLSGMVSTRKPDKGEVLFQVKGQFVVSVRAKLPAAPSSWSGIWLTGTKGDWPLCGEIDILEAKGWVPDNYQMNVHNPRTGESTKSQQHRGFLDRHYLMNNAYNNTWQAKTYSVAKLNDRIDFYLDNTLVHTVKYSEMDDSTPFTDPENGWIIRLSHIIGGSFLDSGGTEEGHDKYVDATKYKELYPSSMEIAYVRVVSLDEPGTVEPDQTTFINVAEKYYDIAARPQPEPGPTVVAPPAPSPQPPTPVRPEPPVVVTPTPTPSPVPKPKGERAKGDWVREEDALVFIML